MNLKVSHQIKENTEQKKRPNKWNTHLKAHTKKNSIIPSKFQLIDCYCAPNIEQIIKRSINNNFLFIFSHRIQICVFNDVNRVDSRKKNNNIFEMFDSSHFV